MDKDKYRTANTCPIGFLLSKLMWTISNKTSAVNCFVCMQRDFISWSYKETGRKWEEIVARSKGGTLNYKDTYEIINTYIIFIYIIIIIKTE